MVRIQDIQLEQLGGRERVSIHNLSSQLNVLFSANSADLEAVSDLLEWTLAGGPRFTTAARDVSGQTHVGSLTVLRNGNRQVVSRRHNGTPAGQFAVVDAPPQSPPGSLPGYPASVADRHEWEAAAWLAGSGRSTENFVELLRFAAANGLSIDAERVSSPRLPELRMRADECRRAIERLPYRGQDLAGMLDRQRIWQQRLEHLDNQVRHRKSEQEASTLDLARRIEALELRISRLREDRRDLQSQIDRRAQELDRESRRAEDVRAEFLAAKRAELVSIEAHIARVRDMLSDTQQRGLAVDQQLDDPEYLETRHPSHRHATQCHVAALRSRIDQLSRDPSMAGVPRDANGTYTRESPVSPSNHVPWAEIRAELAGVCADLQAERQWGRTEALRDERGLLDQSEQILERWIQSLSRQRDQLWSQLDEAARHGVSLVRDLPTNSDPFVTSRDADRGEVRAVWHACDAWDPPQSELDAGLSALRSRSSTLDREIDAAERTLRQLLDERRMFEGSRGSADELECQTLRRELHDLAAMMRVAEERERLQRQLSQWETEISRCRDESRPAALLEQASAIVRRWTGGRVLALHLPRSQELELELAGGARMSASRAPVPDRRAAFVCLQMAILDGLRNRGWSVPLVVHDLGGSLAQDSHASSLGDAQKLYAAQELQRVANEGHQVLVLTPDQAWARELAHRGGHLVWLRGEAAPEFVPELAPDVEHVRFRPQAMAQFEDPSHVRVYSNISSPPSPRRVPSQRQTPADTTAAVWDGDVSTEFVSDRISLETALPATGVIPREVAERLFSRGLRTVRSFLEVASAQLDRELSAWGVSTFQSRRWQQELRLCCELDELTTQDAHVLVRSGILSIADLANVNSTQLFREIQRTLSSTGASRTLFPRYTPDRIERFVSQARNRIRLQRGNRRPTSTPTVDWTDGRPQRTDQLPRRHRDSLPDGALRRDRASRRSRRHADRVASKPLFGQPVPNPVPLVPASTTGNYYLNSGDAVEAAPAIGPRMADRLRAIGIHTVLHLLQAEPGNIARQLRVKQVDERVVSDWQHQARLVCRVPDLRGHDAQIIVACGITDAEQLARAVVDEFWPRVEKFCATATGRRVVRGGREPDRAEVQSWVQAAQQARTLQAA